EIDQLWPGLTETLFHNPAELHIPGGEPFAEFARRLAAVISEIVDRHRQETVICVSHGCATRMILCLALGMDWRYFWNIRQDNTAVNIIEYQTRRSLVTLVNDTGHLTGADRAERYI
ncbi:MAG: histidine phosphatase family protein, partial [Negativicutes bacterium]|nr:histidine phosphatase family protein [Negativicutes bacterium]